MKNEYYALAVPALAILFASVDVLAPFNKANRGIKLIEKAIHQHGEPIMFDDVHLPESLSWSSRMKNLFQRDKNTNQMVLEYVLPNIAAEAGAEHLFEKPGVMLSLSKMIGVEKPIDTKAKRPDDLRQIYTLVINKYIKNSIDEADPAEGYMYFGNQDYTKILPMLIQINPFWGSAITVSGDDDEYIDLIAHSEAPPSDTDSKFLKINRAMDQEFHQHRRVNVRFNKDMTINQIVNYSSGEAVIVPEEEWNYYASAAAYNVFFYANVQHSLIHVYHYYMMAAIIESTKHDSALSAWAQPYNDNVAIKYYEVTLTLFNSTVGKPNDYKVHTGKFGFGGTEAFMAILRDWLVIWGNCKNSDDFIKNYLHKDLYATAKNPEEVLKTTGILTEVHKHFNNVEPFAKDITAAMKADNEEAFNKAEETLTKFLSECGEGLSSIDSISSWIQSMSMTGIVHGATLGFSRMMIMPELMRWRNIKASTFDENDVQLMKEGTGVLAGRTVGRHVFTNEIDFKDAWDTSKVSPRVKAILDKYDAEAEKIQKAYQKEIVERDDFREFGWILTDHCPDGFDGKQHTISSYI